MSTKEINEAIAEACGMRSVKGGALWAVRGAPGDGGAYYRDLPKFSESLDAMAIAEATLNRQECNAFHDLLIDNKPSRSEMKSEAEKWTWHAPASLRAQAFLTVKKLNS